MKIALISFGYNKKTGIEILADNIMQQIYRIDNGNQYILIVNEFVQDFFKGAPGISKKVVKKMARSQVLKTLWLLFVYPIYSLAKGIDITIIFSGTSNFSLSPFTKNIVFIADLGEFYIKNKYDKKRMIYRKYVTLPINKIMADLFIAISKSTQEAIADKLNIDKEKIKLIYCGADDNIQKQNKNNARNKIIEKYGINNSSKIIITIGRIDPVGKNLIRLIEAMDLICRGKSDCHLFLIGGESNYSDASLVPGEIEKRGLNKHVTMTGYIDVSVLNDFYNAADLLVFPSVYEGFGLPLVEAMKCELPVACSDIQVFHEVGNDAVLYFDPYNAADIAEKIALMFSDDDLREQLIAKGKKRYPFFTWENSARELIKLLSKL